MMHFPIVLEGAVVSYLEQKQLVISGLGALAQPHREALGDIMQYSEVPSNTDFVYSEAPLCSLMNGPLWVQRV